MRRWRCLRGNSEACIEGAVRHQGSREIISKLPLLPRSARQKILHDVRATLSTSQILFYFRRFSDSGPSAPQTRAREATSHCRLYCCLCFHSQASLTQTGSPVRLPAKRTSLYFLIRRCRLPLSFSFLKSTLPFSPVPHGTEGLSLSVHQNTCHHE